MADSRTSLCERAAPKQTAEACEEAPLVVHLAQQNVLGLQEEMTFQRPVTEQATNPPSQGSGHPALPPFESQARPCHGDLPGTQAQAIGSSVLQDFRVATGCGGGGGQVQVKEVPTHFSLEVPGDGPSSERHRACELHITDPSASSRQQMAHLPDSWRGHRTNPACCCSVMTTGEGGE